MRSEEGGDPMTVEEMKKKKTELGFSCEQISDRSGVPLGTVNAKLPLTSASTRIRAATMKMIISRIIVNL